jgi:hypothetical protein
VGFLVGAEIRRAVSQVGVAVRLRGPDSPETAKARQDLQTAKLAEHARALVADWPELTDDQRTHVAAILRSVFEDFEGAP